jgi:hypothetical protein
MKKYLLLIFLFAALSGLGQGWCPDGSQWHYSHAGMTAGGYVVLNYSGDTLIENQTAQKLKKDRFLYNYLYSNFSSEDIGYEFTYEDNGVVFIRFNNAWDTLYNFNAAIGDSWFMSAPTQWADLVKTTVVAEGTKVINGEERLYKVVDFGPGAGSGMEQDTIVQGIGSINGYLTHFDNFIGMIDGHSAGPFRCYSNDNFSLYQYPAAPPCEFIVSTTELDAQQTLRVYPNPCRDVLNVELDHSFNLIEIFDSVGRLIQSTRPTHYGVATQIDMSSFRSGIYFIKVSSPVGGAGGNRIIR